MSGVLRSLLVAAPPAADPRFEQRFESFRAGGYDPLTVPPEWFKPTEKVGGRTFPHAALALCHGGQQGWIVPSGDLVTDGAGTIWPACCEEAAIPNTILRGMAT